MYVIQMTYTRRWLTYLGAAIVVAVLVIGCALRFRGAHVISVDPDGELLYHHPESVAITNSTAEPHGR